MAECHRNGWPNVTGICNKVLQKIWDFFIATDTKLKVVDFASNLPNEETWWVWQFILLACKDTDCINYLIEKYSNHELKDTKLFWGVVRNIDRDNPLFEKGRILIKDSEGFDIIEEIAKNSNNDEARFNHGLQIYFNTLFEREQYQKLIEEFTKLLGEPQITFRDLDYWHEVSDNAGHHLSFVYQDLLAFYRNHENELNDLTINSFLNEVIPDWDWFSIRHKHCIIKRYHDKILISDGQKLEIINYVNNYLANNDFIKIKDNEVSWTYETKVIAFFILYWELECAKEIMSLS